MTFPINKGPRNKAVRIGIEQGLYDFIEEYSIEMGMSMSAACRRMILIGARCEADHGKATMPATYRNLRSPSEVEADNELERLMEDEY